ncbi:MAG: hypothetical protein ACRDBG_01755 [Waterburya sp.]
MHSYQEPELDLKSNYRDADLTSITSVLITHEGNFIQFLDSKNHRIASITVNPKQVMLQTSLGWRYAKDHEIQTLRTLYAKLK